MKHLVHEGYTMQVTQKAVEKAIVHVRGTDQRTLRNWKRGLVTLGFLERLNPHVYRMNVKLCPELLTDMLKGERQKKLL